MSKPSPTDRKLIEQGITEAKAALAKKDIDTVVAKLNQVEPAVKRTKFGWPVFAGLKANVAKERKEWKELLEWATIVSEIAPQNPGPYKFQLEAVKELDDDAAALEVAQKALENASSDVGVIQAAAPVVKRLENKELTKAFLTAVKKIENWEELGIAEYLPENDEEASEMRLVMLKKAALTSDEAKEELVWFYLREQVDRNEAFRYAQMLPEENRARMYCYTLLGPDPVGSARKYSGDNFKKFVAAVDANDMKQMEKELGYEPNFRSGWILFCELIAKPEDRFLKLGMALRKFPESERIAIMAIDTMLELRKYDEAFKEIEHLKEFNPGLATRKRIETMIKSGQAANLKDEMDSPDIGPVDRAIIAHALFKRDRDKRWLKYLIQTDDPSVTAMKAQAIWEMREDLGDQCEPMLVATLKQDPNCGEAMMYFGKYQIEKGEKEKGLFLLQKALDLGSVDEQSADLLSAKYIGEEKLQDALTVLRMVNTPLSHFRAGLILQRLSEYQDSCLEFQKYLARQSEDKIPLSALGQSYMIMKRVMSASSVMTEANDTELKAQVDLALGIPHGLATGTDFHISETPVEFNCFLQQATSDIQRFRALGWLETAQVLCEQILPKVPEFTTKWGNLAAVQKSAGDFYLEFFLVTSNQAMLSDATACFKRRAELDKRAESFTDLAVAMHYGGQSEASVSILMRVVRVFPKSSNLWINLGVALALTQKLVFAKHCFCVAAQMTSEEEQAQALAFCAGVLRQLGDTDGAEEIVQVLRERDTKSPDFWIVDSSPDARTRYENRMMAFQALPSQDLMKNLARSCVALGRVKEELAYALASNEKELICQAYEANGSYDMALQYATDEATRQRLEALAKGECPNSSGSSITERAHQLANGTSGYDHVGAGILFSQLRLTEKAQEQFEKALEELPGREVEIRELMSYNGSVPAKTPRGCYISELKREGSTPLDASLDTADKFPYSELALRSQIINTLKIPGPVSDETEELASELYTHFPSTEALSLSICVALRREDCQQALRLVQRLCVLRPAVRAKMDRVCAHLRQKLNMP